MSAQILSLASDSRVDEAWDELCFFSRQIAADPKRLLDRAFMESHAKAEQRWKTLFLMQERSR